MVLMLHHLQISGDLYALSAFAMLQSFAQQSDDNASATVGCGTLLAISVVSKEAVWTNLSVGQLRSAHDLAACTYKVNMKLSRCLKVIWKLALNRNDTHRLRRLGTLTSRLDTEVKRHCCCFTRRISTDTQAVGGHAGCERL